jgi:hypothetical protein
VFSRELAKGVKNVLLDGLRILFWLVWVIWNSCGGKIGAIDGIMDGYSNLHLSVVVDWVAGNTSPHRLDNENFNIKRSEGQQAVKNSQPDLQK